MVYLLCMEYRGLALVYRVSSQCTLSISCVYCVVVVVVCHVISRFGGEIILIDKSAGVELDTHSE